MGFAIKESFVLKLKNKKLGIPILEGLNVYLPTKMGIPSFLFLFRLYNQSSKTVFSN